MHLVRWLKQSTPCWSSSSTCSCVHHVEVSESPSPVASLVFHAPWPPWFCIHGLRILLRNMRENTQARDGLAHLPMIMRRCSFPQRSPVEGNREVFNQDRKRCVGRHLASTTNASTSTFNPLFHSSWSHSGASMAQGTVSRQSCIKQTFRQNLCVPSRLATFL